MWTSILLADDQPEVRSALKLILEQDSTLRVVGEVAEAGELLLRARESPPDLLLLDWELPGLRSILQSISSADRPLPIMRFLFPKTTVIALSGHPEAQRAALSAGVDAFVSKGEPPERLLAAVAHCRTNG